MSTSWSRVADHLKILEAAAAEGVQLLMAQLVMSLQCLMDVFRVVQEEVVLTRHSA